MYKFVVRVCISPVHPLMPKKTTKLLIFFSLVHIRLIRLSRATLQYDVVLLEHDADTAVDLYRGNLISNSG